MPLQMRGFPLVMEQSDRLPVQDNLPKIEILGSSHSSECGANA